MSYIKYIADENHYKEVLSLVEKAKRGNACEVFGVEDEA